MMIVDVDLNVFKRFWKDNFGFYWTETASKFVLVKNDNGMIVRSEIIKSKDKQAEILRLQMTQKGIYCKKINF